MRKDFKGIWIDKKIWEIKELTLIEKHFLSEISNLDNEHGCFASNNYFADAYNITPERCSQIINSLKNKGFISIRMIRKGKMIVKRVLRILNTGIKNIKGGIYYSKEGIKNIKEGYQEKFKGIHKGYIHKDYNNSDSKESLSDEKQLVIDEQKENGKILRKKLWSHFMEKSPEHFQSESDKKREGKYIEELIKETQARASPLIDQITFLREFLMTFYYVTTGRIKSFLNKDTVYIPSVARSKGIWPRIIQIMADKKKKEEIMKDLEVPF